MSQQATLSVPDPLTDPGVTVGTVAYMSPEQVRGEPLDARTDLFSIGVVVYEMATGHRAFSGATSGVIFDAILNRMPVTPARLNPKLVALDGIVTKLLEMDRRLRYQSAADLRVDLQRMKRDSDARQSPVATSETTAASTDTPRVGSSLNEPARAFVQQRPHRPEFRRQLGKTGHARAA